MLIAFVLCSCLWNAQWSESEIKYYLSIYLLYIQNDLPSVTKTCKVILYADATAIIYSDKQKAQIEKHLNNDMEIVKTWLDENKLTLNVKKTKSMLIGNKKLLNEADYLDVR